MGDLDDDVVESLHNQVALNRGEHHTDEEDTTVQTVNELSRKSC